MSRARGHEGTRERHNLPLQRTHLIGRERDVAAVRQAVLRSEGHLVTLTGAGGCGKTRLALQVGRELVEAFENGVWLVELAALADPLLVLQVVARALEVSEQPDRPLLDTLVAYLRPLHLLVVLDNCEHLVEACARLADQLLATCPHLRILATSREPLRLAGEVAWPVPPLAVPDPHQLRAGTKELGTCPAVQLLVARAQAAPPTFRL